MNKHEATLIEIAHMQQGEHEVRKALDAMRAAKVHYGQADHCWALKQLDESITKLEPLA